MLESWEISFKKETKWRRLLGQLEELVSPGLRAVSSNPTLGRELTYKLRLI